MRDNLTEAPQSINVLSRMNILPEIVLAALGRVSSVYIVIRLAHMLICSNLGIICCVVPFEDVVYYEYIVINKANFTIIVIITL